MIHGRLLNIKIGKYVVLFIIITYLLYLILPAEGLRTSDQNEILTVIFLSFVCFSFFLGCKTVKIQRVSSPNLYRSIISPVLLSILLSIVLVDYALYLKDLIDNGFIQASLAVGENYASLVLEGGKDIRSFWGQIYVLLSPIRVLLCAYCVYSYKQISFLNKVLLWSLIIVTLFNAIGAGQQVGIGNVAIIILIPLLIRKIKDNEVKDLLKIGGILFLLFFIYFVINQYLRASAFGYELSDDVENRDNIIYTVFGEKIGNGVIGIIGYFVHGYRGLNYALQLPFEWTNGYGGSRALDQYLSQYLGLPSEFENTYPLRVTKIFQYDCQIKWPTAYAWWASDFSFPGVVVLMFFLGKLVCVVFRDAYYYSNIYAIAFLIQLSIAVIFLSMNNQALQARDSLLITFGLAFLWIVKRKKANYRGREMLNSGCQVSGKF